MYEPKNPKSYKQKAKQTLEIFKKTGSVEKTAAKINREVRTVYRHLNFLGYEFPDRGRDKLGRLKSPTKSDYLKNLEKVKVNGR